MVTSRAAVVVVWVVLQSGCGQSQEACRTVDCSNRGRCVVTSAGAASCDCNAGFVAQGTSCVAQASGSCVATGAVCSRNGDCCAFQAGDGWCVDGRCADSCSSDGQCRSGCCAPLVQGGSTCSPPSSCSSCVAVNRTCTRNGDCCNFLAGDGWCVNGVCSDSCTRNADCVSGCCAPLVGGGATCAKASSCG